MKNIFQLLALILIQCIFSTSVSAQTQPPATLSIQGILKKSNGEAVEDGTQKIIFRLYANATGGAALWTETQNEVEVFSGVYSATLGLITHFDDPSSMVDFSSIYFLGVTVGTSEMTPRIVLTAAPYALSLIGSTNQFPSSGVVIADQINVDHGIQVEQGPPNGNMGSGYTFRGDPATGILSTADHEVSIYSANVKLLDVVPTGVTIKGLQSVTANTGQSINLNTDGSITSTGDIDAGAGDIITTGAVSTNNLNLTGGAIDYGNNLKGWRLVDVSDFSSNGDGWDVYPDIPGTKWGWENGSSTGAAANHPYGQFGGDGILPTDNDQVFKKKFNSSGTFGTYTEIKVRFKYYFIDSWEGINEDLGWAAFATTAAGAGIRIGWLERGVMAGQGNKIFGSSFISSNNFVGNAIWPDHWKQVEMTAFKPSGNSFWVFIGASLSGATNDENFGVGAIEVWVR